MLICGRRFIAVLEMSRRKVCIILFLTWRDLNTSGVVKGSALMLGELGSLTGSILFLLITLLALILSTEKVISCHALLLLPTNRPDSSVELLGKLMLSELK